MLKSHSYNLPPLPYQYNELEPYISAEQLRIHYEKHHNSYANGANGILNSLNQARISDIDINLKGMLKELAFNIGGFKLHSLFWKNLTPAKKSEKMPHGEVFKILEEEFGSFERFKEEFNKAAVSAEGAGWAALAYDGEIKKPLLMQIEKHNVNIYPTFKILMVLDMFEHAYYIDYKNDKSKYVDGFWNIIDWEEVENRFRN
ncbi:superoxide dismutase [Candidatus Falkowbacteria bacterium RBG_13_39_14]|uniref:Superoxide dismutase n=1 Tax=Candidatus Falkowbacteria bacterium RBG_13_39_14 TaxID=1797985 RepID=A0A1F5S1P3_9BACT|nr:MAG: superoxide dismutase [Candidatus Falkowbacteria bacterium RBG_13_39_14]